MIQAANAEGRPILDMNTTPLIDVLLVLLVMFIITIPLQTHAVKFDLPTNEPVQIDLVDPTRNVVVITDAGVIRWNGTVVTKRTLADLLAAAQTMHPDAELHLRPEPNARYELVDEVLAMTKRARVERMGFVGNEAYAVF